MNWFIDFVKPKIKSWVSRETPENLWHRCTNCDMMVFHRVLTQCLNVCPHCNFYFKITPILRFNQILLPNYQLINWDFSEIDPLKFKDIKKYKDRLREAKSKLEVKEAIEVAYGTLNFKSEEDPKNLVIAAFNFDFMGGSMGREVGNAIVRACHVAMEKKVAILLITSSGGARMQESILSLMQMPRITAALNLVKAQGLPYVVLQSNPTMGGVTASFASTAHITLAEEGAMIGFTGARVIESTIKTKLPEGFQTAKYLYEHGMLDEVVSRKDINEKLYNIMDILME